MLGGAAPRRRRGGRRSRARHRAARLPLRPLQEGRGSRPVRAADPQRPRRRFGGRAHSRDHRPGANRARDLGNTPANDLTPSALADYASELAGRHGIEATILDGDAIREHGMGAFAAVAQGSAQSARLIRLDYEGPGASEAPRLGLIGKAVTFDSGGLSLKPAASMFEMKFDMCGGAAVIEAVGALAELEAPVRVMGIVGATENLPGPAAVKPGDIVRAMDGTTIEINDADAEGRLVLSDCITYALREGCDRLVDIATLTGAVITALGRTYAGLMSNDDEFARAVEACGSKTGELLWRLPLHDDYAADGQGSVRRPDQPHPAPRGQLDHRSRAASLK